MPYKNLIREWLEKADLKIENVFQKLLALGAVLSRSTVGRAIKTIKHELDLAAIRYETTPGQQGQVDWGEFPGYKAVVDGVEKPIYALFIVLGYSRKKAISSSVICPFLTHLSLHQLTPKIDKYGHITGVFEWHNVAYL